VYSGAKEGYIYIVNEPTKTGVVLRC
jgi:hypothetical protein